MRSSYDGNILTNSNIYNNNVNSSRNFFGNSSKLENLQNLYFSLNPYAKSTSINSNQQLRLLNKFQSEADENALDKKYGKPIINNYQRFHLKAEEIKKGKGKSLDKNTIYTNYTPQAKNNPNLAFYSLADLSSLHPLTYQNMKTQERYLTSGNLKNYTRLQMVDEKLKKLEEKNEALQTINDIFFDSLKDNLTQSLKRKAFLRKHLKDIEYLKQVNLEEYNNKVKYLIDLVEGNDIDFDNYNFEGEPLNGIDNLAGQVEALKTEIGTMLTKNTMKNDINLNFLKQDVMQVRDELEKKLLEFSENNNKNYEILKEYLYREEKDRLAEKRKRKQNQHTPAEDYIPETKEKFEIKGIKPKLKEEKKDEKETDKNTVEELEESEVSTETNKNIDVIDKILLDSMSLSMTTNGKNVKDKKSSTKSKKSSKSNKEDNLEEKEIELTSSSKNTNTKSKNSKWKLLQESSESNIDNKEPEDNIDNKEIKEEDEINENNIILGSYKSKFGSNKPEYLSKSKRSKKSRKFKLSKETTEPKEKSIKTETKKESSSKTKEEIKTPTEKKEEEEEKEEEKEEQEDENEDDKIEGTESSSATTESFKLTNRSNKVNLNSIKEHQEVLLSSESSKKKSDNEKKSRKSKKSKKSKKKSIISSSIKEKSKEEEED